MRFLIWCKTYGHRLAHKLQPWGVGLTFVGLLIASLAFMVDLEDRQSERTFRAWQVVRGFENQVRDERVPGEVVGAYGSSLRVALEFLNRDFEGFICGSGVGFVSKYLTGNLTRRCVFPRKNKESLTRISAFSSDLTGASLAGANLSSAVLQYVNFSHADLTGADLSEADLTGAQLVRAHLTGANLKNAWLTGADLTGANLTTADLTGVDFEYADLARTSLNCADIARAEFQDAKNLEQQQLNAACGTAKPRNLPSDLGWTSRECPRRERALTSMQRGGPDR